MPTYLYTAKTTTGQTRNGRQEAANEQDLARLLRQAGLVLISAVPVSQTAEKKAGLWNLVAKLQKISLVDKMMFARHLAVMIDAGLSLNQALRLLAYQTQNSRLAKIIEQLEERVRQGDSFADCLNRYRRIFGDLFINMVKVGETSGNLTEVLQLVSQQLKRDHDLQSKTKGAMVYPAVVIVTMVAVGMAMMIIVMPKLTQTFEDVNVQLPWTTKLVIGLSSFLAKNWLIVPAGFVVMFLAWRLSKRITSFQKTFHWLILRLPVFGKLSRKINTTRFARVFSSMIEGGVPVVQALKTTSQTLSNIYFKQSLAQVAEHVQKGEDLSQCLRTYRSIYPVLLLQMVAVGERTGSLAKILTRLADFYEEEITTTTKSLSSIIEPILLLVIGAAVAIFAISIIQPIYSMMNAL